MKAERIAEAWREASPAAVHPELNYAGQATGTGHLEVTMADLLIGIDDYLDRLPSELTILDYGAGPGRVSVELIRRFRRTILADTNPHFLELAGTLLGPGAYELLEVDPIPSELPPADVVLCVNLFVHLDPAAIGELLKVFARALRPGGLVAVQIPVYDLPRATENWTGINVITPATLTALAAGAGLEVLELRTNPGRFVYPGGPNHHRLHLLRRPA